MHKLTRKNKQKTTTKDNEDKKEIEYLEKEKRNEKSCKKEYKIIK